MAAGGDVAKKRVVKKKRTTKAGAAATVEEDVGGKAVAVKKASLKKKATPGKAKATKAKAEAAAAAAAAEEAEVESDVPEMEDDEDEHDDGDDGADDNADAASYDSYSSDDSQGALTRTGDVPLAWYDGEDHAGYDVEGNKIVKQTRDALSQLISKFDDPSQFYTIYEKLTGKEHKLSKEDIQVLLNLQNNKYPDPKYDPYQEGLNFIQWDQNPFEKGLPPKSRFATVSKHEMKIVAKLVRKLRRLEKNPPPPKPDPNAAFLLWNDDEEMDPLTAKRQKWHIGPPKNALPATDESYNPPAEYLKTQEELDAIEAENPVDRPDFVPQKYDTLRHVPFYKNALRERYQRCLDLFAFTRKKKDKIKITPESLLPDLPKPEELRPYPQRLGFVYKGHTAPVRQVSVNHNGQYLATACDDHFARVYEVNTGRLMGKWNMKAPVSCVAWSPNPMHNILAISADKLCCFVVPKNCGATGVNEASVEFVRSALDKEQSAADDAMQFVSAITAGDDSDDEVQHDLDAEIEDEDAPERDLVEWKDAEPAEIRQGVALKAVHHFRIKTLAWHVKGDYVATLCPKDYKKRQIIIMQLSKRSSLSPFKRFKEPVQTVSFHPTQPYLMVGTKRSVRVYNLVQSQLVKKLKGTVNNISSIDPHAGGDNILVGSHDSPVMWYDLDMSDKPYKKLTSHKSGVNTVRFHPQPRVYPLFASAGDNGHIHVFHGRVYDDLTQNPFLVPLKIIKAHNVVQGVGILHLAFHPTLPWVFSAAADGTVRCWTE